MLSTHLGTRNWNEKNPKIQNSFLGLSDAELSARSMRIDNALGAALMNDDLNSSEISAESSRFSFDA